MAKIVIKSCYMQGFEFSCGAKKGSGSAEVTASFAAPWTAHNRDQGKWKEIPDTISGTVKLVPNRLAATNFELKPSGMAGVAAECSEAHSFELFVPTKEGKPSELRFKISTPGIKAGRDLDQYGRTAGTATGEMRITHSVDAQTTIEDAQQKL